MFTTGEIIDLAIRIERNGETVYRKAMKDVSDLSIASQLQKLAEDEAEHLEWFSQLKAQLPDEAQADEALQKMARDVLEGILGEQAFSLQEVNFSSVERLDELMDISIEFERDTVLFYELIGAMIQDSAVLNHLQEIIKEETRHIRQLEELRASRG